MTLYNTDAKIKRAKKAVRELDVPERNRELVLDFVEGCEIGWDGQKLGNKRVLKYLVTLKQIALLLGDREFDHITEREVKKLLKTIDDDPTKGSWSQHDYRIILRKFITWLRKEHGYPQGYPRREKHLKALEMVELGLMSHALEVSKMKVRQPDKLRDRSTIPPKDHLTYLRRAAPNPRDKAFLAVMEELGPRPGGICTRQVKDLEFDDMGARIHMHDKTQRGEPVRVIWSAGYLREWLEAHPFGDDPDAPLWVSLSGGGGRSPLTHTAFRNIVVRARDRHNANAEDKGLPKIPRKYDLYAFRYFAQIRDDLNKMPRSVQMRQRGWKHDSNMPERYSRLATGDVDSYFKKEMGLQEEGEEKPAPCPRCKEVNPADVGFCKRCGLPLNDKKRMEREKVAELALKILQDPELSRQFQEVLREGGDFSHFRRSKEKDTGGG